MRRRDSVNLAIKTVLDAYHDVDRQIAALCRITDLRCPEGCGLCCENRQVESTIPEVLPLAREIYMQSQEEEIMESIRARTEVDDPVCVLYRPEPLVQGKGRCGFYQTRPLLCRLFGFAARKNKYDKVEFAPCRIVKQEAPEVCRRVEMALSNGVRPPVYQENFFKIAVLFPSMGFHRLPINKAIMEALAYLQWKKPRRRPRRIAA